MNVELRMRIVFVALVFGLSVVTQGKIVSRYSFTEGDTVAVDSVGGKDGVLTETAVISGNKLVLDGGGAVELPGDVLDPALESVTIEAWFEVGVAQNWQRLFDFGETVDGAGGNAIFYSPTSGAGDSRFVIATNGAPTWQTGEELVSGASVAPGTPTHVVCVYDGAVPEIRLYQDGVLVGITPTTMILANVARTFAYIGDATYTADPYFNGTVDEFRIHDTALTTQEVLGSYTAGPDVMPAAFLLNHRYTFDEDANDVVGSKDGVLTGTATVSGNKLVLDGGGAVELPGDVLDPNLESVTIEAWFEVGVAQNWQRLFDFGETVDGAGGNAIFYSPTSGAGDSRFVIATNGAPTWQTGEELVSGASIAPGTPTHVVCVYDGAVPEIRLYQDGVLVGITPTTMILANVARVFAYIGDATYTSDPYFNGTVDEFRIYGAALTAQEAQANFLAGPDEIPVGVVPKSLPLDSSHIMATASSSNDATMGPENTINSSGLIQGKHSIIETDMWLSEMGDTDPWIKYEFDEAYKLHRMQVWNYNNSLEPQFGVGVNDVNIVYSMDGTNWMVLEHITLDQAPGDETYEGMSVELNVAAQVVILDINSNRSPFMAPQYGLSEVRFYTIPVKAAELSPADGTRDLGTEVELSWVAGREAVTHEVYLGTDPDALDLVATLGLEETTHVAAVELNTTYYWQVVEVNDAAVPPTWATDVMTFHTLAVATDPGTDSLVHQYTFEDGTANDSVGQAHGTLMGDAAVVDGSLVVDGVDDWMEMDGAAIAINTYTTGLTLELWSTQGPENQTYSMTVSLGGTWANGAGQDYLGISTTRGNDVSRGMIANTPDQDAPWEDEVGVDGPELNDELPHHYVLTIDDPDADGSGELAYYVDGVLQGTTPLNGRTIGGLSNDFVYLGKGVYSVDAEVACEIHKFSIYSRALTPGEVLFLAGDR